jgi:uncharacterized protein involved in exopolysaccharide biosynthesis
MKEELNEVESFERDEISLPDLWRILKSEKKWLLGILILSIALSIFALLTMQPKWEATGVIQIGQVAQQVVGQGPQLLEPPVRAIERMKMKSFETAVLARLRIAPEDGNPVAALFRSTLSLKALGTTDLIQVKIRATSRDQAENWASAVVDQLKEVHEKLAQPIIDRLRKQQIELKKQKQVIDEERVNLLRISPNNSMIGNDSRFPANLLLSNLLSQKNAELRDFEMRGLALDEQLLVIRTNPTVLIDRIYVPEKPAAPKKLLTILLAAIVGLILGTIVAFIRNHWFKSQAKT